MHKIKSIKYFLELLEKDTEYCGIFERMQNPQISTTPRGCFLNNIFIVKDIVKGINLSSRKSCQHLKYSEFIWHTHPTSSKPYPSFEDIIKVQKRSFIKISVIFTEWGVWLISKDVQKDFNYFEFNEKLFNDIYYVHKHSVEINKRNIIIKSFIKNIKNIYGVNLEFINYNNIGELCLYGEED